MAEDIDGAVKWLMKRLMQTTAESFELAFARYETSEREAALAQARRLMESQDPAEREIGERLQAEVLKEQTHSSGLMPAGPEVNGVGADPLSRSPLPSLPAAATPSPASAGPTAKRRGRPPQPQLGHNHQPQPSKPAKRGPGRPPKS
jgi:hypothetical protein